MLTVLNDAQHEKDIQQVKHHPEKDELVPFEIKNVLQRDENKQNKNNPFTDRKIRMGSKGRIGIKNPGLAGITCGTSGSRTSDTRIFSPLLYQLSYGTNQKGGKDKYFFLDFKFWLKKVVSR